MRRVQLWIAIFGVLVLALAGCGGEDDTRENVALQAPPTNPPSAATTAPTAIPTPDPQQLPQQGALLIVRGDSVLLYPFPMPEDNAPVLVAQDVDTEYLSVTPDGGAIMYGAPADDRYNGIYLTDLATLETTQLVELDDAFVSYFYGRQWSPDGDWVVLHLSTRGLGLVRRDGTGYQQIANTTNFQTHWLEDGRLLLVDGTYQTTGDGLGMMRYEEIAIMDPATDDRTPVDIDIDQLNSDPEQFDAMIEAQGLTIARPASSGQDAPRLIITGPNNEFGPRPGAPCDTWHIASVEFVGELPQQDTRYTVHDVYRLSSLMPLDDGSALVLEWHIPDCKIINPPVVQLRRYQPDGEPVTIADSVYTGMGLARSDGPYMESFTALSPDQRFVVWLAGSLEQQHSAIYLTNLETGTSIELLREDLQGAGSTSDLQSLFFSKLYWVTPGA